MPAPAYSEFYYPLNVFMHILTHEEGAATYLHYGFFENPNEPIAKAQERSTAALLERLPPAVSTRLSAPARLLDAGSGLGTTLRKLHELGYRVTGITPDAKQVAAIGDGIDVRCIAFEAMPEDETFDTVIFQESSQYIDSEALFAKAAKLTRHVIVLDEFTVRAEEGASLHALDRFLAAARANGFEPVEDLDVSAKAAPTIDYFAQRFPRYRDALKSDLALTDAQIDSLIDNGVRYRDFYDRGVYAYRVMQFRR
ncbi:MAG TPA: methyltransferase domain-containing protein [Thermoanaerobaculia bacterium]|jgi:SAM-dependent methyltransferase|nr:methyltransferase domain-containing protein [Thermoanaerobaculia bacterium]